MKIVSPRDLNYPVTVIDLLKKRDEDVQRSGKLFNYSYDSRVTEGDKWGGEKTVMKKFRQTFAASTEGKITRWFIKPGTVIERHGTPLLEIEEPCTHETQFGGLCVDCGKDMTQVDYLTKELGTGRATVNMAHDNTALLVSHKEAVAAEEDAKKRLLSARKLTLIVDLDQTVIHTTCERTIAEWKNDPENPNHDAVKDVEGFQLADDNVSNVAANWYYVKMRPGLKDFFDRVSKLYEMHVYTMATRAYAQAVAKIIDPERKYFGDRILSRDENYTDKLKSLTRLFYQNTAMCVIIDDRADVWQYSPHLVRVPVFNFFPGAGDINASFLPKQQELVSFAKDKSPPTPKKATVEAAPTNIVSVGGKPLETTLTDAANGDLNELGQQLISLAATEDLEEQAKEQEKLIIAQQTERPLLQQQLMQDKEDEEADGTDAPVEDSRPIEHPRARHSILNNDDRGLDVIEQNLNLVHRTFYDEYRKARGKAPADGRVAALKGEKSPKKRSMEDVIPDVAEIMPRIKNEVLDGTVVVFSGIIPLGVDVLTSDFALWISSFGAEVTLNVTRHTTHVIANPDRKTTKVKRAARYPHIKIVNPEWMFQCCTRWEHVDETPYIIETEAAGSPVADLEDESIDGTGDEAADDGTPHSPIVEMSNDDWAQLDDELADFMNATDSEASESDTDSVRSENSTASTGTESKQNGGKKKRKRTSTASTDGSEVEEVESDSSVNSTTSRLQRRKKRTMERVTSLTNVVLAESKSSGLPSPETTGPEEDQGEGDDIEEKTNGMEGAPPDLQDDYDDGLEAELLAGFGDSDEE
ncbi:RNA polymerase II subunit A C-terminal domain phosphatase [Alternaria panax]|uniref:RNA polymerase II subunit A C-terminal domain phosphatase n=1 Tax=Alternaria panax TaxID=48097 RepID=A0AAD4I8F3_9PLEO|nr:RNA polymerase II subunit A C-terminal domain phosphatase [Alternaria panax]